MTSSAHATTRSDRRLRTAIAAVALSGAVVALATAAFGGSGAALSAATGASLAAANLWLLARIVTSIFPDEGPEASGHPGARAGATAASSATRASAGWTVVVLLKMIGLFGVVWLLMRHGAVSPLPMLVGFGALPIGIAIGSLVSDRSAHPEDH
ncbi:MAG: hypothetical protein M3O36_18330 [Myxococcota bacterium]|nr:hypothetical protein [Myxococcota bacterium]